MRSFNEPDPRIETALRFVEANLRERLTVAELAGLQAYPNPDAPIS